MDNTPLQTVDPVAVLPGEISFRGRAVKVPSIAIGDTTVVVTGKWLKLAIVKDEEWMEGEPVPDPELVIRTLQKSSVRPDIFKFSQPVGEDKAKHPYHLEWDNAAAISITTFSDWWEAKLSQASRKNVRRSEKRGVVVRSAPLDDELVEGIRRIYNETPIRQGRRFWHYGKDFDSVKRENSTYIQRSEFVVAYFEGQVIGFIKMVYVGKIARMMQILALNEHFDKRPMNAMLAKAVEVCLQKGASHLVYGKYVYGNKANSEITEFKRRNGFDKLLVPTYYIPLTIKGRLAVMLKLHLGLSRIIPERCINLMLRGRTAFYKRTGLGKCSTAGEVSP